MTDSSSLDRLLKIHGSQKEVKRGRKHSHPAGWSPGIQISADGGYIVTDPRDEAPEDWNQILAELLPPGIDPDGFSVEGGSVEVRAWDSGDGEGGTRRLYYFKARIRRRSVLVDTQDLEDVIAAAKAAKPKKVKPSAQDRAYWIQITDLQAGQSDGRGVEGMVEKALQLGSLAVQDISQLALMGKPVSQIFIPVTGDLVEGIVGWYEMQQFSVELDRRDQVKLVRRLLTEFLIEVASVGVPVHVAVVPGNHGENRQNGKAYTTLGDNDDVAVVEQIAEAFALSGKFDHVTFTFPAKERISLTVEVLGWVVGLTHGHIARGGGTGVEGKILGWFKSMAATRDPLGDSDLLFTGHYHHARNQQLVGDTWWIQGGALCDASAWFSQSAGLVSDPVVMKGTITRDQLIETVMPHVWPRTKVQAMEISA